MLHLLHHWPGESFSFFDRQGQEKKPTLGEEIVLDEAETFISKGASWESSRGGNVRQLEYSEARQSHGCSLHGTSRVKSPCTSAALQASLWFCSAPSRQAGTWNMLSIPCSSTFHRLSLYVEAVDLIFKIHTVLPFLKGCSIHCHLNNQQSKNAWVLLSLGFLGFFPLLTDWTEAERAYSEAAGCVGALLVP